MNETTPEHEVRPVTDADRAQGIVAWERGLDPWHADAFKGTRAEGAFVSSEPRRSGWDALDWCGNQIGWVPDEVQNDGK